MKKNAIFKAILLFFWICAALAAAELIARVIMPMPLYFPRVNHKEAKWKEYRGVVIWDLKHVGHEDLDKKAIEAAKRTDAFKIVGLGDSIMFGSGIDAKDTYMSRLGSELEKSIGRKVEVADLSQPGYNIRQESALFELLGVRIKPDLIIVHAWEDDLANYVVVGGVIYGANVYTKTGVVRTIPLPPAINEYLILRSRFYQSISLLAVAKRERRGDEIRRGGAICRQALESIYKNAQKSRAEILILLSPNLAKGKIQPFSRTPDKHALYYMITDWAKSRNVKVIDLSSVMAGVESETVRVDDVHFNKKGHDIILKILTGSIPAMYKKHDPAAPSRGQ
ncbi:MAG: SGNH/GDSL hydrolase family protein [bacterium]